MSFAPHSVASVIALSGAAARGLTSVPVQSFDVACCMAAPPVAAPPPLIGAADLSPPRRVI
ncbi:hypothetical protein [Halopseudomonas laoshanensis]|uniref:hypothetical protein n=1 Tax=Halopseudomonas laoshanensis TaxID=2268758 RepID=UPI0037352267